MRKQFVSVPFIVATLMLFAGVGSWPYWYYTALRIVVSSVSIYGIILACYRQKKLLLPPLVVVAVLFNPFFPLSLSRKLWFVIDVVCGVFFIFSSLVLRKTMQIESMNGKRVTWRFFLRPRYLIPAFIIIMAIFIGKLAWVAIHGNERLIGLQKVIPEPEAIIPPIEKGESDWPCWRGPNGDGKSSVTGIIKNWSGGLQKLWEVNYLCQGESNVSWSSLAVSGNRLVVPGRDDRNDLVFCLNSQNGELIWFGSYKAKTGSSHGPGARATPYIDDDRVYTFGRGGDLVCWSLENGNLLWRQNVQDEGGKAPAWGHSSSPLVYQDKIIVQGGGDALVIAYDKITGQIIWKSLQGDAGYAAITCMNMEDLTRLLVFHGKGLSCIDPDDGTELWSVEWQTDYDVNATTPAVSGQVIFITSGYNTGCMALKVNQTDIETLWKSKVIASQHSDPIIIDGYIYGYSGQSQQNRGYFKCVELKTGREMWSTDKIGWGTTLYVDENLLCLDIKGNLFLVEPDPDEFKLVSELRNALGEVGSPAWTIPVIANGKLYLRYLQRLICYEIVP